MFIIMSFSYGLAFFILTLMSAFIWGDRTLGELRLAKLKNLLGVFVGAVFFFTLVYHLTNLYITQHHGVERFILLDGGIYTAMFWIGQMLIGTVIPVVLLYAPAFASSRNAIALASFLVLVGGFAQLYVIVIGGSGLSDELVSGHGGGGERLLRRCGSDLRAKRMGGPSGHRGHRRCYGPGGHRCAHAEGVSGYPRGPGGAHRLLSGSLRRTLSMPRQPRIHHRPGRWWIHAFAAG